MERPRTVAATLAVAVLDLLAPPRCPACRRRAVPPWCPACTDELVRAPDPGCARCGGPRRLGHGCWPPPAPLASTAVVYDYRGPVPRAVVTAKVGGAHAAWAPLAALLAERVAAAPPAVDVVTWVPTAPSRVRRRGCDHAAVLAQAVGGAIGVPVAALLRAGAGEVPPRARRHLPGTEILLVDDVLTTGRTAATAAAVLRAAGADRVHLAVLARAGDHQLVGPDPTAPHGSGATSRALT